GEIFPIYDFANRIDREFLQGAWDLRGSVADGTPPAAGALKGSRVLVEGDAITLVFQGATSRGTFRLDSVPTPRTLDVAFPEGPEKGNSYLGIYEIEEDTWRFCRTRAGKGRPTAFAARAGSGHLLETLRRATVDSPGLPPPGAAEKARAVLQRLGSSYNPMTDHMVLCESAVTDDDLYLLAGLTGMRVLNLNVTGVSDRGLAHLTGLTELRTLYLSRTRVTDAGLKHLEGLPGLQNLVLSR